MCRKILPIITSVRDLDLRSVDLARLRMSPIDKDWSSFFWTTSIAPLLGSNKKNAKGLLLAKKGVIKNYSIDLKGSKKKVGKPTKQDQKKGKSTLISLMGEKKTLDYALKLKFDIIKNH